MIIPERTQIGDLMSDRSLQLANYWHGEIIDIRRQADDVNEPVCPPTPRHTARALLTTTLRKDFMDQGPLVLHSSPRSRTLPKAKGSPPVSLPFLLCGGRDSCMLKGTGTFRITLIGSCRHCGGVLC